MGQITSLFAWKFARQCRPEVDRSGLLRSVGVDPEAPVDPSLMVADEDYYRLLERMAEEDGSADLQLRTGASMRCDDYGAFGLAYKSAVNLRGSFERAERYARVLTSVSRYEVELSGTGAFFHLHRDGDRRLGLRMSNEASLTSALTISREVSSGPVEPKAVFFKHPPPPSTEAHERFFGCPVLFDSDRDAFLVSRESLEVPNKVGDASIARFIDGHLEREVTQLEQELSLEQRVRVQISSALSEGIPKITDVARPLGMSGRTLQRRLSENGSSFQTLVDEARQRLAKRLLEESAYGIADVAYLTGFSDQSAFTRAFKRWAGQTPRSYRLDAHS